MGALNPARDVVKQKRPPGKLPDGRFDVSSIADAVAPVCATPGALLDGLGNAPKPHPARAFQQDHIREATFSQLTSLSRKFVR